MFPYTCVQSNLSLNFGKKPQYGDKFLQKNININVLLISYTNIRRCDYIHFY